MSGKAKTIFDFVVKEYHYDSTLRISITGKTCNFAQFRGNVMLIVNTASACGLTPHYQGLQTLYEKYHDRGFTVIAFPCNQFLSQESGTSDEIQKFVTEKYGVTFPVMEKSNVQVILHL